MSSSDRSLWTFVGKLTSIATASGCWKFFKRRIFIFFLQNSIIMDLDPSPFLGFVNRIFEESLQIDIFLTPRGKVEPDNMRLNHIENRFHAWFYVNQRFSKRNLTGYIENLTGNIFAKPIYLIYRFTFWPIIVYLWFCMFPKSNGWFLVFLKIRSKWKPC